MHQEVPVKAFTEAMRSGRRLGVGVDFLLFPLCR